ncbi:glycosyltransferase family 39 protein [Chloroflexota bacterium]
MKESEGGQGDRRWLSWAVLLLLMGVALALRWRYIQEISLFVDEFVTAWAARNVLIRGLPSFPSGNIYPHGFLFTYLVAPFVSGEFNETLVRLPALVVSLVALPVAYWVGRQLFSDEVGLITAAGMAVDPAFIVWGGRVRMYGLLQLVTLLVVYFFYRGLAQDRARDRWVAMVLLVMAIFTHAEAAFLIPILGAAALVICPWRRLMRWSVVLPFGIAASGAAVFYVLSRLGQPGHLETLQESRPYLAISMDALLASGPLAFASVFTSTHRLPLTILLVVGLYFLFRPRFERSSPFTYLYVIGISFVLLLSLLSGTGWQRERYLFLVLPVPFLIGAEVLNRLVTWLLDRLQVQGRARTWQGAVVAMLVALFIAVTGSSTAFAQEWGYDLAFRHLRDRWQPEAGDRIATSMSTAALLYLGRNDAFAIQQGYEEYVVARPGDGLPSDLWTATPILTTTAGFEGLLSSAPRVWFVTDGWRLQTRYEPGFIMTVLDQMELEYNERGVLIFRGEGYTPMSEPAVEREVYREFSGELALDRFALSSAYPQPGDELGITLYWRALEGARPGYVALLHLVGPDGVGQAGLDEPVLQGLYQPDLWPKGAALADFHRLSVPGDLPEGRYRLDLGLYYPDQPGQPLLTDGQDRLTLATLTVGDDDVPAQATIPTLVDFGDQLRLLGYDLSGQGDEGDALEITFLWRGTAHMERDYTVFVHVVEADGTIVAQGDAPPGGPFFPTSTWMPGDGFSDRHRIELPAGAPHGEYTVLVGVYHQPTAERLQATGSEGNALGDAIPLLTIPLDSESP